MLSFCSLTDEQTGVESTDDIAARCKDECHVIAGIEMGLVHQQTGNALCLAIQLATCETGFFHALNKILDSSIKFLNKILTSKEPKTSKILKTSPTPGIGEP